MARPVGHPKSGGRKKGTLNMPPDVKHLAQLHTAGSIMALVEISNDRTAPHQARINAANSVLNRGWGQPAQSVEAKVDANVNHSYAVTFKLSDLARPGTFIENDETQPLPHSH